jgi:hypothetical protein
LIEFIKTSGLDPISYYVQNCIIVNGVSPLFIEKMVNRPEVVQILSNNIFRANLEKPDLKELNVSSTNPSIEWNINYVKAPQAWAKGFKGKGFTIANADTGVEYTQ